MQKCKIVQLVDKSMTLGTVLEYNIKNNLCQMHSNPSTSFAVTWVQIY